MLHEWVMYLFRVGRGALPLLLQLMYVGVIPTGSTFCTQNNKQLISTDTLLALLFVHERAAALSAASL